MIICGIDPGLDGAIAFLHTDGLKGLRTWAMPTLALTRDGKNKREIDARALTALLSAWTVGHVFIEQVGPMPKQMVSSVFAFGKGYGIAIGIVAALGLPHTFVLPQVWKKALHVPKAKDGARARASQLLPYAADQWPKAKDDGRAEAAMIALYGITYLNVIASPQPKLEGVA